MSSPSPAPIGAEPLFTASPFVPLHAAVSAPAALSFIFRQGELLVREEHGQGRSLPGPELAQQLGLPPVLLQPLGMLDGRYYNTAAVTDALEAPPGYAFVKLRSILATAPVGPLSLAGRAFQIAEWARTHRFCGACATPMERVAGERCMRCPACGVMAYPRISPAMMVLITRGEEALLARNVGSTTGMFSALAGFVEAGEAVEETVHREVFEEVGLRVHKLRYFGSQPWPFPHSLMIAFTAEYLGGELRLDEAEIAEAAWFRPGQALPPIPGRFSIAGHLLRAHFGDIPE